MSGHSKWANIRHKKEKTDAQKGKIFTKLGREIAISVKEGGADPDTNSKLKDAIAKAKANNMPNDTIERSIKKASGELDSSNYEEIVYEGYGPSGVAVIVEALTGNRNRTAGDMRHYFDKFGGNLGANGCVSWSFDKKGVIIIEQDSTIKNEEEVMMDALDLGAEDFSSQDNYFEILTLPDDFGKIRDELEKKGYIFASAQIEMVPQNYVKLTNEKEILLMNKLIEHLEDNDDVQNIWHNYEE